VITGKIRHVVTNDAYETQQLTSLTLGSELTWSALLRYVGLLWLLLIGHLYLSGSQRMNTKRPCALMVLDYAHLIYTILGLSQLQFEA
jgi:hypothetical protein